MAENSKIEWTDHTFNPWVGCTKISPGCDHCYAEGWAKRAGHPELWNGFRRRTTAANWRLPFKWDKQAEVEGVRKRVFCASLADVFDLEAADEWRMSLWQLIRDTPHLDWLLLTKRIGNASAMLPLLIPANVWLGITVVNQVEADRDIPKLLAIPARIRFLSCEPMLGEINLGLNLGMKLTDGSLWNGSLPVIDWVICGGESGNGARSMQPEWARSLKIQCAATGTAFFMKQGSQANWHDFKNFESFPPSLQVRQWPVPT